MKFVRVGDYLVNLKYVKYIYGSPENRDECVVVLNDKRTSDIPVLISDWNKAVRDAGVPDLQWFDK